MLILKLGTYKFPSVMFSDSRFYFGTMLALIRGLIRGINSNKKGRFLPQFLKWSTRAVRELGVALEGEREHGVMFA